MGFYYFEGITIPKNYVNSIKYFSICCDCYCDSLYYIGECYFNGGNGISQNIPLAIEYFKQASERMNIKSQFRLGFCYFNGLGFSKNYEKAFNFFLLSSNAGYKIAYNYIGICYEYGRGVDRNLNEAIRYYDRASSDENSTKSGTMNLKRFKK